MKEILIILFGCMCFGLGMMAHAHTVKQYLLNQSFFPANWIKFDPNNPETHPKQYDKYFVHRKDGKVHWETWNGSGWAYNGNVITHYMIIEKP